MLDATVRLVYAELDAAKQNLGNVLAVIFGDGGHRQAEINNDEKAVEEAIYKLYETRVRVDELEAALQPFADYAKQHEDADIPFQDGAPLRLSFGLSEATTEHPKLRDCRVALKLLRKFKAKDSQ